ncbi:MAG: YceI family protein [Flavobacteriales bacterium]
MMKPILILLASAIVLMGSYAMTLSGIFEVKNATIKFDSAAPEENIKATSTDLKGVLNTADNKFAFSVAINTFQGFNSALQREHFLEDYMEAAKYPKATFTGKLIDKFDSAAASQKIRAKGQVEIHGLSKERILDIQITREGLVYKFSASFDVPLADHGIRVPRVVNQKIAETIKVQVDGQIQAQ